ncbi:MAG: NUDIX domain-containing protein [Tenuifilaceae bacterium]|nr:NUDIX domain-containing protein [Tenuifilaceae bacterium]
MQSSGMRTATRNGLFVECSNAEDLTKILVFFQSSRTKELYVVSDDLLNLLHLFTSQYKIIDAGGGLVTNNKGSLLLIRRNGFWDLPKGKVDKGETIEQAAVREVEEECGVSNLQLGSLLTTTYHTYTLNDTSFLKRSFWYSMSYSGDEMLKPQLNEGITDAVWVKPDALANYLKLTYESIKEVFRAAGLA